MGADHHNCRFPESTQRAEKNMDLVINVGIGSKRSRRRRSALLADVGAVHEMEDQNIDTAELETDNQNRLLDDLRHACTDPAVSVQNTKVGSLRLVGAHKTWLEQVQLEAERGGTQPMHLSFIGLPRSSQLGDRSGNKWMHHVAVQFAARLGKKPHRAHTQIDCSCKKSNAERSLCRGLL